MKKTIVASIIGVVATVASYGQGSVLFSSYATTTDAIVTWKAGDPSGLTGPATGFTASLYYGFGTITDPALLTLSGITQAFNAGLPGYFTGGAVTIPGYTGGPITFQVVAYNGADFATSSANGASTLFTLSTIATGQTPVGDFGPGFQPFQVSTVPEPSTLALIGLGAGALLFLRRRK